MERVLGLGGVFFRAKDPRALAAWYAENLGVPVEAGQSYGSMVSAGPGEQTVFSTFPEDTDYFGPGTSQFMLNFRVSNLEAMLAQLVAAGVEVTRSDDQSYGKFGWGIDPEGNRFELWEPEPAS